MKLCFVVPRCGANIVGGAETLVLQLAQRLQHDRGHQVTILTSCAEDNRSWKNVLQPGVEEISGVKVQRFLLDERDLETWVPLQISIANGRSLTLAQELEWMNHSVKSAALLEFLYKNSANYDAIFFAPYLFGFTFWGSLAVADKAWLIPCLHDESYAYTKVIEAMFRIVNRALFNSVPEQELALSLYGPVQGGEVGLGFEALYDIAEKSPILGRYAVVLGRKETGKNVQLAIDYFIEGKSNGLIPQDLKLVIAGGGDFKDLFRDSALQRSDIVDVTRLTEPEKLALLRAALVLIQPSTNESFSIVLMEAWLCGTPVLVHGRGAVTRHHVLRSTGGLYFLNSNEFSGALALLCEDSELRATLGKNGADYVRTRYSWPAVLDRFESVVSVPV